MKWYRIGKNISSDFIKKIYVFRCYFLGFIPVVIINDWGESKGVDKEGRMTREFLFIGIKIYEKKHKTYVYSPSRVGVTGSHAGLKIL